MCRGRRRSGWVQRLQRLIGPCTLTNRDRPDHHRPSHPRCWNTQSHPELVPPRTTRAPVSSHQPSSDTHLTTLPKPWVIGVPDVEYGEELMAWVKLVPGGT